MTGRIFFVEKISGLAILALLLMLSGCIVWDAGDTDNRPIAMNQISADEKVPITYSVSLEVERPDIIALPGLPSLRNKIGAALRSTGLFSSVRDNDNDGSYHVKFSFRQSGMSEAESAAVGLLSGFTLLLVPTWETYTFDGTVELSLDGKSLYSSVKNEKMRCVIWLPMAPFGLFMNSWTAWSSIEEGNINALVNEVAECHRKNFSSEKAAIFNSPIKQLKDNEGKDWEIISINQARTNAWNAECAKWTARYARNRFVSKLPPQVPDVCSDFRKARKWQAVGLYEYEAALYSNRVQRADREVQRVFGPNRRGYHRYLAKYGGEHWEQKKRFLDELSMVCERELALAYGEKLELDLMNAVEAYAVSQSADDRKLISGIFDEYPEAYDSENAKELARKKFMAKLPVPNTAPKKEGSSCSGTGWFVTSNKVVTCAHVVAGAKLIEIELKDGTVSSGSIFAVDTNSDVAIIDVSCRSPVALPVLPTSEKLAAHIFTIGYPMPGLLGKDQKYTEGTISSLSGLHDDHGLYQVSVPLQPGNSGGAVVNDKGMVIGIASSVLDSLKGLEVLGVVPQNVNYVIKSRYIVQLLEDHGIDFAHEGRDGSNVVYQISKATVLVRVRK